MTSALRPTTFRARARLLAFLAAVAIPVSGLPSAALVGAAPVADGACTTTADAGQAAVALYGAGTELVSTDEVAGMTSALVLEPRVAPGTRRRMLEVADGWCDAAAGFNRVWQAAGDGAATAAAYATVAAAPYFDGVTVRSVRRTAPGTYTLETHALTNGVVARWVVATDGRGVRTATWTATAFAVRPLTGEIEGLTALPGATETYTRLASGLLAEARGLPTVESAHAASAAEPSIPAIYTGPDGMKIHVSVGDTHVAVDPGVSTGVREVDFVQETMKAIKMNYDRYHSWGLRKGWKSDLDPVLGPDVGWVYLNDALSLYCLACVFIADDFQIHMITEVVTALSALGFTGYNDARKAYYNVVGHEMFHNFQNAYNKPGPLGRSAGRGVSTAYSEGTARFQETLHGYSDVSFAPKTLFTGGQTNPPGLSLDANHCNGYGNTETSIAAGPFGKTYNACYFWTSWYNQNGHEAFVRLITDGFPAHATRGNTEEGLRAIATAAPGVTVADQLAFFAQSALTGRDKVLPVADSEATRDWGSFLFRWNPPVLEPGGQAARAITGGGVHGRRLAQAATVSLTGDGLALYVVRADAEGTRTTAVPAAGATVEAPADGESVWIVAVNPTFSTVTGTLAAS